MAREPENAIPKVTPAHPELVDSRQSGATKCLVCLGYRFDVGRSFVHQRCGCYNCFLTWYRSRPFQAESIALEPAYHISLLDILAFFQDGTLAFELNVEPRIGSLLKTWLHRR